MPIGTVSSLRSKFYTSMWRQKIGEFFDLEGLSEICKETGRYTFFFTSWPLNMLANFQNFWLISFTHHSVWNSLGGCASPPNAAVCINSLTGHHALSQVVWIGILLTEEHHLECGGDPRCRIVHSGRVSTWCVCCRLEVCTIWYGCWFRVACVTLLRNQQSNCL